MVHTYHGHVFERYFSPLKTRLFLGIERYLARFTDRLLAVSESVRRDLLRLGIGTPERVQVIPLGLDLDGFLQCATLRGQFRAELKVGDAPLVGIIARLVPIKRHEDFLAAAPAALAEAIASLLAAPERRRRMGEAGRRRVLKEFGVEAMVDGTAEVYRQCVSLSRSKGKK